MGTAVLFPQDCLRPRSRFKNRNQVMIYPLESAPRSKRNRPASLHSSESGLLPLPTQSQHSVAMGAPWKGNDVKHIKTRKASDVTDSNSPLIAAPDLPVYRILQRPKQGDSATELLAHFAKLDKSGLLEEVRGFQVEASVDVGCARPPAVQKTKDLGRFADGSNVSSAEGFKHTTVKVVHSKLKNVVKGKLPSGFTAVKPITAKAAGKIDIPANGQCGEEHDSLLPKSLARLRRTTTEPPMATKHIVGQCTRRVMHISFNSPKLEAHAQGRQYCGVDLSCEERWAGPAYSASPPPSSLPLPKLCLPHGKVTSLDLPPLKKQYSTSVYTQSFLEPSGPTFMASGNVGDVAFATKSLRRLLNLDSC